MDGQIKANQMKKVTIYFNHLDEINLKTRLMVTKTCFMILIKCNSINKCIDTFLLFIIIIIIRICGYICSFSNNSFNNIILYYIFPSVTRSIKFFLLKKKHGWWVDPDVVSVSEARVPPAAAWVEVVVAFGTDVCRDGGALSEGGGTAPARR